MDYLTEEVLETLKAHRRGAFILGFVSGVIVTVIFTSILEKIS